jgi:hypothetical protein
LFVECNKNGERSTFPRRIAWEVFGPFATAVSIGDIKWWRLYFPDGGQGELDIDDDDEIDGFSINRYGGYALFEAVFTVMKQTSTYLYTSEARRLMVADVAVISEIDPEMIEAAGKPVVVSSGREMADVNASGEPDD